MMIQGSRLLNDNGPVLGLNIYDLLGAMGVLVLAANILAGTGVDFLALPIAGIALLALIPIRLRYRRKILRDYLYRLLLRLGLNGGRIYAPKRLS